MKKATSAGGVVLNDEGMICVVNQRGKTWSLPKGHLEEGETLREAALREITEETGLTELRFLTKLGSYTREANRYGVSEEKTIHLFLFTTTQRSLSPRDAENPEARWVHRDEVASLLSNPVDKAFFLSIKERLPHTPHA